MAATQDNLIGQTLGGRYVIEQVASQEHLGRVYAAHDLEVDAPVHVKVLTPSFVDNPKKFARFGREITATWLVSHPNTVEVLDWGNADHLHYLVTEPLVFHTLEEELEGEATLPVERVAAIAAQVASAIGAAHQEGIVHRALAPRNVLVLEDVEDDPVVKVRDFGMSKLETAEDEPGTQTTLSTRVDDLAYMAPEYLNTGHFLKKSDLYSLGALMYRMITGKAPPTGGVVPPMPPSKLANGVPAWLDELVLALLAEEPNERPGAYKVVQRLEAGTGQVLETPRVVETPVGVEERRKHEGENELARVAGVFVLVVALLVGTFVIVVSGMALLLTLWVAL